MLDSDGYGQRGGQSVTQEPGSWSPGSAASWSPGPAAEPARSDSSGAGAGAGAGASHPDPSADAERAAVDPPAALAFPVHSSTESGPVSPWAHAGYLPPVEPIPAPVLPAAAPFAAGPVAAAGPAAQPWTVAPTPTEGRWRPGRVEPVAGTGFGVVHLQVAPLTSGLAVGSLMAGIAAVLVSFVVLCFGLVGASEGWGPWVAGAFTVLAGLAGAGGIGLGMVALRQIRSSGGPGAIRFTGRGVAIAGVSCGGAGLTISLLALATSLLLTAG
jgi:hypothetical protein